MAGKFKVGDPVVLSRKAHKEIRQAFGGRVGHIIEVYWGSLVDVNVDGFNLRSLAKYEIRHAPVGTRQWKRYYATIGVDLHR